MRYVLAHKEWHAGVIGIVAGRLAEAYHRPAIVISLDGAVAQGSARSIFGFDLYQAIQECAEGLLGFGGHAAAAGLKLTEERVPSFSRQFEECCRRKLTPEQLDRVTTIDAEVPLAVLSRLGGRGNRELRASRTG